MKTVNDFLNYEAFYIKDTEQGGKVVGLQINVFGETELSEKYGNRIVLAHRVETEREVYNTDLVLEPIGATLVLYI